MHERVDNAALMRIIDVLTEGSPYAYYENLAEGYLTLGGVRVALIGNPVRSLVFRIPVSVMGMGRELFTSWRALGGCGTLIVSPPGGGKTTALRALAMHIGSGPFMRRVTVVDTVGEFLPSDYRNSAVDIITGRSRDAGIEAAVRFSSPEVVMCDEVYSVRDAEALLGAQGAGVTVIATAHGTGINEVRARPHMEKLFALGVFSAVISICRQGGEFFYTAEGVGDACSRRYTDSFCLSFN